jgi:hypothetical protein
MALHHTCKPLSFAETHHIHNISRLEEIKGNFLSRFKSFHVFYTELLQMISRAYPSFFEMAGERLVYSLSILRKESELKGIVAIPFLRLLLNHGARAGFDNGHWDD